MSAQPLFAGGVLHGGEDAVDGDGPDAVLRVGEVRADLNEKENVLFGLVNVKTYITFLLHEIRKCFIWFSKC